jgi:hypothetical protein
MIYTAVHHLNMILLTPEVCVHHWRWREDGGALPALMPNVIEMPPVLNLQQTVQPPMLL